MSSLRFESVEVHKMYGLRHSGVAVDDLSDGVNVIYGPNASGKSTLARALRIVCWPELAAGRRAELSGRFELEGSRWSARFDHGHAAYQKEGIEASPPALAPFDQRDRYVLALHDLLSATNKDLAAAILEAAAGGYSVTDAQTALGFKRVRPQRSQSTKDAEARLETLQAARQREEETWAYRDDIERLETELAVARSAQERVELLERARAVATEQDRLAKKKAAVAAFPEALGRMSGDERQRYNTLKSEIAEAEGERQAAAEEIEAAEKTLKESRIPEGGLPDKCVEELSGRVGDLKSVERSAEQAQQQLAGAKKKREAEWSRIEGAADEEAARSLGLPEIQNVASWAKNAESARARQQALDELKRLLVGGKSGDDLDPETLRDAVRRLRRWLRAAPPKTEDTSSKAARPIVLLVAVATAAAGVAGGLLLHSAAWGLLLLSAGLFYAYSQMGGAPSNGPMSKDDRAMRRRDFEEVQGVEEPPEWAEEAVRSHIDALEARYDSARLDRLKRAAWEQRAPEKSKVEDTIEMLEKTRAALASEIGVALAAGEAPRDGAAVYYLTERIGRWQDALAEEKKCAGALKDANSTAKEHRSAVNERLSEYGFPEAGDSSAAKAHVETLRSAWNDFKTAQQELKHAKRDQEKAEERREKLSAEKEALFKSLDLEPGDEAGLARRVEQLKDYRKAEDELRNADAAYGAAREKLEVHDRYEKGIEERPEGELTAEMEELQRQADQAEDLSNEIAKKKDRIEQATERHDVEEAQAAYQRAVDALEAEQRGDLRTTVGDALAEHVHRQTRDQELPKVFHEARDLFLQITQGRYRLDFDRKNTSFAAYDTRRERGMALDQLSSGTRVQLLLAVRVAFVSAQERGAQLPLILDETLANSDDEKARAIIEAVQQISASGRQVFYFTAQDDEVAKWKALQDSSGIDHRFVMLDGAAAEWPASETAPVPGPPEEELPAPDGRTHAQYGEALGVPAWSPRAPLGTLHLWYLIDRVDTLHRILSLGISRWGPFQALAARGGAEAVGLDADTVEKIEARARVIEAWQKAWRTGRGRKVDRAALEATDAVTDSFIDEVAALAEDCDGDAVAIIESLRAGDVKRFRVNKMDTLEVYFEREGFIDTDTPLTEERMRARILAAASENIEQDVLEPGELWDVLERL